jgi:biotin synthase
VHVAQYQDGGCSEDCAYCAQSAHYSTGLEREELLSLESVLAVAARARAHGATRFCMGAAWRGVHDGSEKFERVLEIVREVSCLGMEVCVTLGEIGPQEAKKLRDAGVTAYNHNIDTSPEFYSEIVSTHTFQNRLDTIAAVQQSGMSVCCGDIIGMGESETDRLRMLEVLNSFDPPPESVPINCLMTMPGAPDSRAKARRSASLPARIQFFTVTNFSPQKIPRLTWTLRCYATSDCSIKQ